MNQKMGSSNKKNQKRPIPNNFLEALRGLSGGVADAAVKDVAGGVMETAFNQIAGRQSTGELKPNQTLDLNPPAPEAQLENQRKQFTQEYLDIRRQEKLVYKQVEQETKLQIAAVLEELKKLSLSTKNLAKEVEVASQQVPVEPGIYHVNFFERLKQTIVFLKKKIDESATWLSACNQRSKKQGHYWNQVKKSGTKFMLSQERYMATQAG